VFSEERFMLARKNKFLAALVVALLTACASNPITNNLSSLESLPSGHGVILGTFSIKGYLPDKPVLALSSKDGAWRGQVMFEQGFGTKYDIPLRHADVILFTVPPGTYRVDGTWVQKTLVIPHGYAGMSFRHKTDYEFTVEEGKVTYIGDLFFLFAGGFGGLNPQVKEVAVTDKLQEDGAVIKQKIPNIDALKIVPGVGAVQPNNSLQPRPSSWLRSSAVAAELHR
jgi:hypothetical protein